MRTKMLTAVSALALMAAAPAFADTAAKVSVETKTNVEAQEDNNADKPVVETVTEKDLERGWKKTKTTVSEAAEATGEAIEETYYDIKDVFTEDSTPINTDSTVTVKTRTTAEGMIGKNAYNVDGEAVAKIEDIIINQDGDAEMIVLRDGGFFGLGGKLVALDYDSMTKRAASGDIVLPVSESMLDKVAEFSYDREASEPSLRVIPSNGMSVAAILAGHVQDNNSEDVADIDNITFVNGEAEYLVIRFNETLEMGGDQAVMEFDDLTAAKADSEVNFKLTAKQSADFKAFAKKVKSKS